MGTNAYSIGQGIHNVRTIGQLLGGVLGLPSQVQQQTQQAEAMRALLPQLMPGLTPEQAQALAPQPGMQFLNPGQGGTLGKILGGVGDVGTMMQTITGGQGTSAPPISLEVLAALQGRNLDREKFAYTKQHDVDQLAQEERRTSATEQQADAATARASRTGTDRTGDRKADDRTRRTVLADTMGIAEPQARAQFIETGRFPKTARRMTFDDFVKARRNEKDAMGVRLPPREMLKGARKDFQLYQRELARQAGPGGAPPAPLPSGQTEADFDETKLSPAGQIAFKNLQAQAAAGADPDEIMRKARLLK